MPFDTYKQRLDISKVCEILWLAIHLADTVLTVMTTPLTPTCRILRSSEDRQAARALVHSEYAELGYLPATGAKDIADYLTNDNSIVFGAHVADCLYGTIAVLSDNPDGLPTDVSYKAELEPYRNAKASIAEVVQFSVNIDRCGAHKDLNRFVAAAPLFACVLGYAKKKHLDYLCVTTPLKHAAFYESLGFVALGAIKEYPSASIPVTAQILHVSELRLSGIAVSILQPFRELYGENSRFLHDA